MEAIDAVIEDGDDPREAPELLEFDELPERSSYLAVLARQGDQAIRTVAREVLKVRAEQGEPEAVDALRALMLDADGPDFERVRAAGGLYFAGELPRVGSVDLFLAGRRRELPVRVPWVRAEPSLPGMTDEQAYAFVEARKQRAEGKAREACRAFAELLTSAPTREAQLALKHELAVTQLPVKGLQQEGERWLRELLGAPDCPLRTRAYQAMRELGAGIEDTATQLVSEADEDGPYAFDNAVALLTVREELAWKRGEEDRALAAWIAHEALGAFEIGPDGTRYERRQVMFSDADQPAG